tara:strand:- start:585 stop:1205 length:621 start_codon:yes stop_codon:yes gene_type:complete
MANLKNTRTRKRGIKRKYSHSSRITPIGGSIPVNSLLPGQLCSFNYKSSTNKDIYDRQPLILFLYKDIPTKLIHAINLNYLSESDVQRLFKKLSRITSISIDESKNVKDRHVIVDISHKTGDKKISPIKLYESIIKPDTIINKCYRTYSLNSIFGSVKLFNYRLDIVQELVRKQLDISKGEVTDRELHKSLNEGEHKVKIGKKDNK